MRLFGGIHLFLQLKVSNLHTNFEDAKEENFKEKIGEFCFYFANIDFMLK
jgi:hypothetical protein